MIRTILVLSVVGLLTSWPGVVRAQYGDPSGYAGYGWGGWGSTPQSSLARGLGYFNRDITDGDALNLLLGDLTNAANGSSSMRRITTPLRHELIPEIPFAYASEGITICLDQMTMNDQWPLALRVDDFKAEREGLRKAVQVALEEDKKGDLEPATVEAVQTAVDRFRLAEQANGPPGSSSVGQAAQAGEGAGSQALGTAEDVGTKAVNGLKAAAVDFFKDMDWKHLTRKRTTAKP